MLLANEAVATRLMNQRRPAIYRVHEEPDERRLQEYREEVLSHNVPCANLRHRLEVQKLLQRLNSLPIGEALKIGFLKSLMRARYAVEPLGQDASVGLELQASGRAGLLGAFHAFGGQRVGVELERRGDVAALGPAVAPRQGGRGEATERRFDQAVHDIVAGDLRKAVVDQRRLAVADGIAEESVAIGHVGIVVREKKVAASPPLCGQAGGP